MYLEIMIFEDTYLLFKKISKEKCKNCGDVCVWDKKVKYHIDLINETICTECWFKKF